MMTKRIIGFPLAFATLVSLTSCRQDDIRSYRVPKESVPAAADMGAPPAEVSAAATGDLHWEAPPAWEEQPAGGMRAASYLVRGKEGQADMSVVVLPGDAGGDLANVNRWRGQVGLPPIDEAGLARESRRLATKAGKALVVEFAGAPETGKTVRCLAAILLADNRTWFFKMMGDDAAVRGARGAFLDLLGSLHAAH